MLGFCIEGGYAIDYKKGYLIGVDLFAGAGGLSLGARMAGIDVKLAVEKDFYAAKTYTLNHPDTIVINDDVCMIRNIPESVTFGNSKIVLFGGPPCQGFSTSNRRTNSKDNPQNWLYREFIRIINLVMPEWIVFENVTGFVEFAAGEFVNVLVGELLKSVTKAHIEF